MLVPNVSVLANFPLEQSHDGGFPSEMPTLNGNVGNSLILVGDSGDHASFAMKRPPHVFASYFNPDSIHGDCHIVAFLGYHYTDLKGEVNGYFNLFFMPRGGTPNPKTGRYATSIIS
jgi:hypothetical protein